jgi:hypothetical protein
MGSFCKEEKREEKCGNQAISGDAESGHIRRRGLFQSINGRRCIVKSHHNGTGVLSESTLIPTAAHDDGR